MVKFFAFWDALNDGFNKMFSNVCKRFSRQLETCAKTMILKNFEDMPGPKPLPIVGNLWRYIIGQYSFERLHITYDKLHKRFGSIVREVVFGDRILVHAYDPEDMWKVYNSSGSRPVRLSHRALEKYRRDRPHLYSCPGLFPSNGEEWMRFRKLFQKVLLIGSTIEDCSSALEDVTGLLINKISNSLDEKNEIDMTPLLFEWAVESIGMITLNRSLGCLSLKKNEEASLLVQAADDTHTAIYKTENHPFSFNSYKKLESAQNYLASVVQKYLDEAEREGESEKSVLGKMLRLKNADKKDIFTMILDMYLAGIDTTAFTLSFALYNLTKNPEVQDKLREELLEHLPTKDSRIQDFSKLKYLMAVVNETLRVNPVAIGTGRILQNDLELGGYIVPAQTMVVLQHQIASLQEKHFPNPMQFIPERWIRREYPSLVSSPFGYGARMCVGKKLALRELHIALAKMVRNFKISYHYEDIDSYTRLINVPDKALKLRLEKVNE